jgi:pyruvate carboxylase
MSSYLLQSRKELTKSVSFHSDTHPEDGKAAAAAAAAPQAGATAAAAPQAGATAAVTLGSAYVKVNCTSSRF